MGIRLFIIIAILYFVSLASYSFSQRIQGAVIGGFNLAQVDGDEVYGFKKFGANAGLAAIVPVGDNFLGSMEILFNQKGSYQGKQYLDEDTLGNELNGKYNLRLNYLEVPFLFMYNDKDIITGGVGFSYGRLVGVREYEHGRRVETTTLNDGPYERDDFNILADVRFRIYKKLKLNIRYAYSLSKIRTRVFYDTRGVYDISRDQFNNLITFRLVYMFNEKPPLADSKNKDSGF
ncbi:MAG: PorT family protein [Bacteroidales bacterium]|nr:PorT family protein [Bacteroidales bacterium]